MIICSSIQFNMDRMYTHKHVKKLFRIDSHIISNKLMPLRWAIFGCPVATIESAHTINKNWMRFYCFNNVNRVLCITIAHHWIWIYTAMVRMIRYARSTFITIQYEKKLFIKRILDSIVLAMQSHLVHIVANYIVLAIHLVINQLK